MSSWLLPFLLAAQAAPPPVTAEQALTTYRQTFDAVRPAPCAAPERTDELVVCGRRGGAERLPLPVEREPGEPVRLLPGESPRASVPDCVFACHSGFVGVNLKTAKQIADSVGRLIGGDD